MINPTFSSRQHRVSQILILTKSLVERNQFKVRRFRKSSQICVSPDVRRKRTKLREGSPSNIDIFWLVCKDHSIVVEKIVVDAPSIDHRNRIEWIHFPISRNPKKPQLRHATKSAVVWSDRLHPSYCRSVMDVRIKIECEPNVDIRKIHSTFALSTRSLHHRGSPEFFRSSSPSFQAPMSGTQAARPFSRSWRHGSRDQCAPTRSREHLPAALSSRRLPPHRFEQHLEFPCRHYGNNSPKNQVCGLGWGSKS